MLAATQNEAQSRLGDLFPNGSNPAGGYVEPGSEDASTCTGAQLDTPGDGAVATQAGEVVRAKTTPPDDGDEVRIDVDSAPVQSALARVAAAIQDAAAAAAPSRRAPSACAPCSHPTPHPTSFTSCK